MSDVGDELRALIREVIRDVLPKGLPVSETVNLFTDEDLAAFVARLLDLDPEAREDLRAGRKRFRLAVPSHPQTPQAPSVTQTASLSAASGGSGAHGPNGLTAVNGSAGPPTRRIERGAVTEKVVRDAARAGERLVLGAGAVLTPLARDRARASGVEISRER
ncbi:MAG TPA: hypothetical protein VJ347_19160 [Streptosporangiaceae bacterium]|jgi:hypothetical protein|nr:hypothetical protein [Streptosporangiaceae bacterium]